MQMRWCIAALNFFFLHKGEKKESAHVATYVGQVQSRYQANKATQVPFSAEENTRSLFQEQQNIFILITLVCVLNACFYLINKPNCIPLTKWTINFTQNSRPFTFVLFKRTRLFAIDFNILLFVALLKTSHSEDPNGPASSVTSFCFSLLHSWGWIAPCWQGSQLLHAYYEEALHLGGKQSDFGVIHPPWSCSCFGTGCTDNILFGRYVSLKQVTDGAPSADICFLATTYWRLTSLRAKHTNEIGQWEIWNSPGKVQPRTLVLTYKPEVSLAHLKRSGNGGWSDK